jgi:DNA-binding MarR family transcriptional regulator
MNANQQNALFNSGLGVLYRVHAKKPITYTEGKVLEQHGFIERIRNKQGFSVGIQTTEKGKKFIDFAKKNKLF